MSSSTRVFLVDIDGVACEHAKAICERVNKEYGLDSCVEDVTTWDHDFGPLTFVGAVERWYSEREFILNMEVTPGFREFYDALRQFAEPTFATVRSDVAYETTRIWVSDHFGECTLLQARTKADLDGEFLIDDSPKEIRAWASKRRVGFLLDRPWNREEAPSLKAECAERVRLVRDLNAALRSLKE